MPFDVTAAARFTRQVVIKFNQEKLEVHYNAGEQYREYQLKANQLDQEFADLQRRLQRAAANMRPAATQTEEELEEDAQTEEGDAEDVYEELKAAMNGARRRIADNVCTIITSWDLEGDLEYIRERMSPKDKKRFPTHAPADKPEATNYSGHGPIPIDGAWLDALPLPDEFILSIVQAITDSFESGGAGGKGSSKRTLKQAG